MLVTKWFVIPAKAGIQDANKAENIYSFLNSSAKREKSHRDYLSVELNTLDNSIL